MSTMDMTKAHINNLLAKLDAAGVTVPETLTAQLAEVERGRAVPIETIASPGMAQRAVDLINDGKDPATDKRIQQAVIRSAIPGLEHARDAAANKIRVDVIAAHRDQLFDLLAARVDELNAPVRTALDVLGRRPEAIFSSSAATLVPPHQAAAAGEGHLAVAALSAVAATWKFLFVRLLEETLGTGDHYLPLLLADLGLELLDEAHRTYGQQAAGSQVRRDVAAACLGVPMALATPAELEGRIARVEAERKRKKAGRALESQTRITGRGPGMGITKEQLEHAFGH